MTLTSLSARLTRLARSAPPWCELLGCPGCALALSIRAGTAFELPRCPGCPPAGRPEWLAAGDAFLAEQRARIKTWTPQERQAVRALLAPEDRQALRVGAARSPLVEGFSEAQTEELFTNTEISLVLSSLSPEEEQRAGETVAEWVRRIDD